MKCSLCKGTGGYWDTPDGQAPLGVWDESPEFWWIECLHCEGMGEEPPPRVYKMHKTPKGKRVIRTLSVDDIEFRRRPLPF